MGKSLTLAALALLVHTGGACTEDKPAPAVETKVVTFGEVEAVEKPTAAMEAALSAIVATCSEAKGTVQVRRGENAEWNPVEIGMTFRAGDWVRTGADSLGIIQLTSGGSLLLEANTSILIGEYIDDESKSIALLTLEFGIARGASFTLGDVVMIKTGEGEAARLLSIGEGTTEYRLTASTGKTEIAGLSGSLSITFGEVEKIVESGEIVDLAKGGVDSVSKMVALPTSVSPAADTRLHYQPEMSLNFRWKPVRNATGYKVQVSDDLSFLGSTRVIKANKDSLKFSPRDSGIVAWRVAAHDKKGHYGEWGDARRAFLEKDPPQDLLLEPKNGAKLAYVKEPPKVDFSWRSLGDETSYRLVVSRSSNPLRKPVINKTTELKHYSTQSLKVGTYTWGVYTDDKEAHPLFLSPRRIEVQSRTAPKVKTDGIWD